MSNTDRLSFAIIEHLSESLESGVVSGDAAESLEVAIQCLEQVFSVDRNNKEQAKRLKTGKSLQEIFDAATQTSGGATSMEPTAQDRQRAEELKNEGNQLMKDEKYQEAIRCYSQAIELDNTNSVFPCNRAAAYSKLGEHQRAIEDCQRALRNDPKYGKAYGRMGLSYQSLNNFEKAKESYSKAIEMEPENAFYKNNLALVESRLQDGQQNGQPSGAPGGNPNPAAGLPNMGGVDFSSLLSNPAVMNMAQTFMQSSQVQQMVSSMMTGGGGPGGGGMGNLFQAAQSFGDQMQQTNPELFNELRTQAQAAANPNAPGPDPTEEVEEPQEEKREDGNN